MFLSVASSVAVDAKTKMQEHTLRCGTAIRLRREKGQWTRRQVHHFTGPADFWPWLERQTAARRPAWVFGFEIGHQLTLLDFWDQCDMGRWRFWDGSEKKTSKSDGKSKSVRAWRGALVVQDPPTILAARGDRGTVRMVDTRNYFRSDLAEMATSAGQVARAEPAIGAATPEWSQWSEWAAGLVEGTMCAAMDRWEQEDSGCWQATAAGLAWSSFRHTMEAASIVINHDRDHTELARDAYFGGQAEAYYVGHVEPEMVVRPGGRLERSRAEPGRPRGPVTLLDVRSLYPAMMRDNPFPINFIHVDRNPAPERVHACKRFWLALAAVRVKSPDLPYPVRFGGGVRFCTGEFDTCLAGPELWPAVDAGHVERIHRIAWYAPGSPFVPFVTKWAELRQTLRDRGDRAGAGFCKAVLLGLYGKWAQRRPRWRDAPGTACAERWGSWYARDPETGAVREWRGIAGHAQMAGPPEEGRDSFPAVAAFVTSYARRHMLALRSLCPPRSVLYQDTDSLMLLPAGFAALDSRGLVGGDDIGRLQFQDISGDVTIHCPKDYEIDGRRVASGVPREGDRRRPGVFDVVTYDRLQTILADKPRAALRAVPFTITLTRDAQARRLGRDGWTHPYELREGDPPPF